MVEDVGYPTVVPVATVPDWKTHPGCRRRRRQRARGQGRVYIIMDLTGDRVLGDDAACEVLFHVLSPLLGGGVAVERVFMGYGWFRHRRETGGCLLCRQGRY